MGSERIRLLKLGYFGGHCLGGLGHKKFRQIKCQPSLYIGIIGLSLILEQFFTMANFVQDYRNLAPKGVLKDELNFAGKINFSCDIDPSEVIFPKLSQNWEL